MPEPPAQRSDRPVIVTGASGRIGRALVARLTDAGIPVRLLVRRTPQAPNEFSWDPIGSTVDPRAFEGVETLIHLAGASVNRRWTRAARNEIRRSRVLGTLCVIRAAGRSGFIRTVISASAIGLYGFDPNDPPATEASERGTGFLADVCHQWEDAARQSVPATEPVRLVLARIGVVLDGQGGALESIVRAATTLRRVPYAGAGDQWMSWVSMTDCVRAIESFIDSQVAGPVNITAPTPITHKALAEVVAARLQRPTLRMPAPLMKIASGRLAEEIYLGGRQVTPAVLANAGFQFEEPDAARLVERCIEQWQATRRAR